MKARIVCLICLGALSWAGCTTTRVASGAPGIAVNDHDAVWVTRAVAVGETGHEYLLEGLFACYRPPAERPGEPVCYLAKYVTANGPLRWGDMHFPPAGGESQK
jgi:hypothetical protein